MITIDTPHIKGSEWTLDEIAKAYERTVHPANAGITWIGDQIDQPGNSEWMGGLTGKASARALFDTGWRDGANRIENLARTVTPPTAKSRRRAIRWRDNGDELSVDRAMAGDWDTAWRTSQRVVTNGPATVEVHALVGGNAGQSADELFWAGAACAVVTDILEGAGYAVRLVATTAQHEYNFPQPAITSVVIKEADEPLRLDALATLVCHAGIFRSHYFRAIMSTPAPRSTGLGSTRRTWAEIEAPLRAAGMWPEGVRIDAAYDRTACLDVINRTIASLA